MKELYRSLTVSEILKLQQNSCFCDDWNKFQVKDGFDPRYVKQSLFSGTIKLGSFSNNFELEGGLKKHSGIYKAILHNCTVGDNVLIENIHDYIANYTIGEGSFIQNINTLVVTEKSTFGNGTKVAVLDETGGREIKIYDRLTSHFAYIYTLYRYRPRLIAAMDHIVTQYTEDYSSNMGTIGKGVIIKNTGRIKNVRIGDSCCIEGAARLTNGSLNSNATAPIYIGCEVVISDFIVASGSSIDEGTILSRCFVGQACKLGHAYSASDSLFFSNCQGENGEACAIFAGPYTVTHHKSTLLIAGMFSFINAGSGSNQSNHMYKLGPIHQGVVERGAKTTSNSYVLWPAHIGAFSLIMGRHYKHPDTSLLPFSYLIEKDDETYLVPAVNIRTVGTTRDFQKWPKRDARKDPDQLDKINFSLLNPFTVGKMIEGIHILQNLREYQGYDTALYNYNGCLIANSALKKGIKFYQMAVSKFFGDCLIEHMQTNASIKGELQTGTGKWIDLSGLIAPKDEVEKILIKIESGKLTDTNEISKKFALLHANYNEYAWNWVNSKFLDHFHLEESNEKTNKKHVLQEWLNASIELDLLVCTDAKKEFNRLSIVGFGVDGNVTDRLNDLSAVRGSFEENSFILAIKNQIEAYRLTYKKLLETLEKN